jgi:putative hemolysin
MMVVLGALVVTGCVTPTPAGPDTGLPNSASVYCEEQGYTLETRTDENGTYGVCIFTDGSECEEWAYFRGECGPGKGEAEPTEVPAMPTGEAVLAPDAARARDAALDFVFDRHGEVVFPPPGAEWTEEDITEEGLVGRSTFKYTAADVVVTISFPLVNPADTIYQVVVSKEDTGFRWEGSVDAAGQVTESSAAEGVEVLFEGVSFSYDDALAADVVGEAVPATDEDAPEWVWKPTHIRFSFDGYALPETFHEPRILVFSAEDLAANEMLKGIAANIERILEEKPEEPVGVFQAGGILPPMNAGHMMPAPQVAYVDFRNGTGVRFLTQMGQAYYAINNRDLFYTFQGMTHDGAYYVAAILPISHPSLPADGSEIPGGDFEAFSDNFETYAAEVSARLDAEPAGSFAPSIALLDEMMQSLTVTELSLGSTPSLVVAWYGYVASTPEGGQFDDYLVLLPEEARRAVGIEGADEAVEAEIVALRDREEPGKYAHFWGTLNCDVPDYAGCQVRVTRLRVDGPGPFFEPDPVDGWEGTIASGPVGPRSGGDDYLVVLVDGIPIEYGIDSTEAAIAAQIESLRDTGAVVRVWGQLSAGVIDWNGTQIQVDRLEVTAQAVPIPGGYEGWEPYRNAALGYTLRYPGDSQVMGANLNESVQFSGPLVDGEHWPVLTVSHYDSEFYQPPAGADVAQWIADHEIPYDEIDNEEEISGLPAVHLRSEAGPGWYASDSYYIIKDGQLFQILILHTGGREDWALYDRFLEGFTFVDMQ